MWMKKNLAKEVQLKQLTITPLIFFVLWVILTGSFTTKNLVIGLIAAVSVTWLCSPILYLPAVHTPGKFYAAFDLPYGAMFFYFLWLGKELVKANIEVALLVLHPGMPIKPQVVEFTKRLDHPLAQTLLAQSIILTPGTIAIDVIDDRFTIHALTKGAALSLAPLEGEGEMPLRIARLFGEKIEVK